MRVKAFRCDLGRAAIAAICLVSALASCALANLPGRVLYQKGRTTVGLEMDPSAGGPNIQGWNTHPAAITSEDLAVILQEMRIRSELGLVGSLLSLAVPAERVFTEEEVSLLAPVIANGLTQASPVERIGFTVWCTQRGRCSAPLSGHVAVRDSFLRFGLNEHPTVGWQDPEDPSAPKLFELEFVKERFVRPVSVEERKATRKTRPLLQIEYRRYLSELQATPPRQAKDASASSDVPVRDSVVAGAALVQKLQRRVKELADSNQELRSRVTALQQELEQVRSAQASQTPGEELARLRQELAETKQLLADKVLELNRLESKSKENRSVP